MSKRSYNLVRRKKNKPSLLISHSNPINGNFLNLRKLDLEIDNALFFGINGRVHPIFHPKVKISVTLPIEQNDAVIIIEVVGFFTSITHKIHQISGSKLNMNTLLFDRAGNSVNKLPFLQPKLVVEDSKPNLLMDVNFSQIQTNLNLEKYEPLIQNNSLDRIRLDISELEVELNNQFL